MKHISRYGIFLRSVEEADAEFIITLRTDPKLNKYISTTSPNIADQIKWIKNYKLKEKLGLEYYFIVHDMEGNKFGTIRIYNLEEKRLELGSWLFLKNSPFAMAVKAHFIGLETGFELLKAEYCKIEVRKKNIGVVRYVEDFKPKIINEDDLSFYFILSKENYYKRKNRLALFQ